MRVWEMEQGRHIIVTNKRSIVTDPLPPLTEFQADTGRVVLGVVSKVFADSAQVCFFGGVRGVLPLYVLQAQGVADVAEAFRVGQVGPVYVRTNCMLMCSLGGKVCGA